MGTPEFSSFSRTGMFEELCKCSRETPAEESRETSDTSQQPSDREDKNSELETSHHELRKRVVQLEEENNKQRVWAESVETRLQALLETSQRQYAAISCSSNPYPHYQEGHWRQAFSGHVTQKEFQEKEEENKKLKARIKELEARNEELLSKAMGMHKHSENVNDPWRLSAVLQMYEMFRLRDWERFRSTYSLTYKSGSIIIKKLFDACEEDIQQRKRNLFEVLGIPPCNETVTKSNQGMMQEIRNILKYLYYQGQTEFYSKIVMQTGIDARTPIQREFTEQCCKIYCLLLLQDPPLKAVWNSGDIKYLEHVDKKGYEYWRKPTFLWPIIKCGEQVVVKGVVWDEKQHDFRV